MYSEKRFYFVNIVYIFIFSVHRDEFPTTMFVSSQKKKPKCKLAVQVRVARRHSEVNEGTSSGKVT